MPATLLFGKLYLLLILLVLGVAVVLAVLAYRGHEQCLALKREAQSSDKQLDPAPAGQLSLDFRRRVIGGTILAILGGSVLGGLVLWRLVAPLGELYHVAESIVAGDYSRRLDGRGNDELSRLARAINHTSAELSRLDANQFAATQQQTAVLRSMVEGVVAVDDQQRVLLANPAAGKLFGFEPAAAQGRPLLEVIRQDQLYQAVADVIETGTRQEMEITWQGETPLTIGVQVTPVSGPEEIGVVIVLHDNTELRRLETIRQEFLANVSHELKTPLSSIMAYSETLLSGAMDDLENRERFLQNIAAQGERLNELIGDMLTLARIETAQQPFEIVSINILAVAQQLLRDYATHAESKNIQLAIVADVPEAKVLADTEGLRTILSNLVDNAIKYTPDGGSVTIDWNLEERERRETAGNAVVRIRVIDTGVGIPRSAASRVFERFYRVDRARSRQLGSTGLGLAIVKHLAQSFGGMVGVESDPGQGSTFWVELPGLA